MQQKLGVDSPYHHDHGSYDGVAESEFGPDGLEICRSLSTQALYPCLFLFEAGSLGIFWGFLILI